jgi:hypothetical protein
MKRTPDWVPSNHEALFNQATATTQFLTIPVLDRMGISGASQTWYSSDFYNVFRTYVSAYSAWLNPANRTPAKTAAFLEAEVAFKKIYRKLYTGYIKNNPLVTDEDLVNMGMPKHSSGGRTPSIPPTDLVEATVDTSKPGMIIIHYRTKNSSSTAKPRSVHGVEIVHAILDKAPKDWSELIHSSSDTRTPAQLVFSGEYRGKTVYFALRWENSIGKKGPWSEIYNAIIP